MRTNSFLLRLLKKVQMQDGVTHPAVGSPQMGLFSSLMREARGCRKPT